MAAYDMEPYRNEDETEFTDRCMMKLVEDEGYSYSDAKDECEMIYSSKKEKNKDRGLQVGFVDQDLETTFSGGLLGLIGKLRRP